MRDKERGDKKMRSTMTSEQAAKLEAAKERLIEEILKTQDVPKTLPLRANGTKDFDAEPIMSDPLNREEVAYLVDRYYDLRLAGMSHSDACRITYNCAYRHAGEILSPRTRIAELKANKL